MGVALCSLPFCFYFLGFFFFSLIENQKLCVFSQSHTYQDKEEMTDGQELILSMLLPQDGEDLDYHLRDCLSGTHVALTDIKNFHF